MTKSQHLKMEFNGKKYKYIRSKTQQLYGYHISSENGKPGTIAVGNKLKGRIELDTNIHEMLHACGGFANEDWVNETAKEIAKALWQLGYRKNESSKKYKKVSNKPNI